MSFSLLIINNLYSPKQIGGAEKSVQFLAESLVRNGVDVSVLTISGKDYDDVINGVKVYYRIVTSVLQEDVGKINLLHKLFWHIRDIYNYKSIKVVKEIIDIVKPDFVHTNNIRGFSTSIWGEIKKFNIPILHTPRDYYLLCLRNTLLNNDIQCIKMCFKCRLFSIPKIKSFNKNVTALIPASNFVLYQHQLLGIVKQNRDTVIYNPAKISNNITKNSLGEYFFGYIGYLSEHKGIEKLLKIFSGLNNDKISLLVAGKSDGDFDMYLKKKYESSNIKFVGFVNPESFYNSIKVLIVPSLWHEPIPRTIIEAYSYGIPVIGSDRGGITEIIDDGVTGKLYSVSDDSTFISVLQYFINNQNAISKLSKNILDYKKRFDPDVLVKCWLKLYKSF